MPLCNLSYPTLKVFTFGMKGELMGIMISGGECPRESGVHVGEMERDAVISHGAGEFLRDRMCLSSDVYRTVYCRNCHTTAISVAKQGPSCRKCGINGEFGICTTPRAFLYFKNLLAGAGINIGLELETVESIYERLFGNETN